jgi:hypothetical protein
MTHSARRGSSGTPKCKNCDLRSRARASAKPSLIPKNRYIDAKRAEEMKAAICNVSHSSLCKMQSAMDAYCQAVNNYVMIDDRRV